MVSPLVVSKTVLYPHTKLTLREDGVIELICGDDVHYRRTHIEEINKGLDQLAGDKRVPLLVLVGIQSSISKDGREYAASEESTKYSVAEAYVIRNVAQRIVGNFYIRMDKPPVPTRLFTSKDEAEKWLGKFKP